MIDTYRYSTYLQIQWFRRSCTCFLYLLIVLLRVAALDATGNVVPLNDT